MLMLLGCQIHSHGKNPIQGTKISGVYRAEPQPPRVLVFTFTRFIFSFSVNRLIIFLPYFWCRPVWGPLDLGVASSLNVSIDCI